VNGQLFSLAGENTSHRAVAVLLLFALLAWIPGFFTTPPLDRDESRFAQASKQMIETGNFVEIRLGEEARDQKPVGIYWLQAVSTVGLTSILGLSAERNAIWTYRVPSLIGGIAALLLTFFLVRSFASPKTAFFAALLLGSTLLLMAETHIAKTDAFLLAMVLGAQSVLLRAYLYARKPGEFSSPSRVAVLAGWACFGFGILVKGPIIITVCAASVIAISLWDREWKWFVRLRSLSGLALTLVLVLPWLIAIGIATEGAFFSNSLGGDFAAKLVGEEETHGAPPGYYSLLVFVTFWPAAIVLLPGVLFGIANRGDPAVRYLLIWAATTWLMFEFAPTKLPHYTLPAYPALAILGSMWLTQGGGMASPGRVSRILTVASPAIFLIVALALAGALLWLPFEFGNGTNVPAYVLAAGAVSLSVVASISMWRRRRERGVVFAAASAVVFYVLAWHAVAPSLNDLQLSPRIARAVAEHARPSDPPVVLAGYAEPSIRFLLGTGTQLVTGAVAGEEAKNMGGLYVIEEGEQSAFEQALEASSMRAEALSEVSGVNYSNGRRLMLTLYRVEPS
jgi:4-amino-4-deoxy-L-arabinose transferase-like glycosyltransferase